MRGRKAGVDGRAQGRAGDVQTALVDSGVLRLGAGGEALEIKTVQTGIARLNGIPARSLKNK